MTKNYENPEIEVVKYNTEDVLNESQGGGQDPTVPTQATQPATQPIVLPPDLDE